MIVPSQSGMHGRHRILYLIDRIHAIGGGAEGVLFNMCRLLPDYGFQVSVATFAVGDGVKEQFPCPIRILPNPALYHWSAISRALAFRRLLRSEGIEIVHTFFPASDLWGGTVARLSRCPIVISSRRDMGILRSSKHRIAYRLANSLFTQVQAVSEKVREYSIGHDHLSADRVVTVPNGIDCGAADASPALDRGALGFCQNAPLVITVANIRHVKGIDILLRAAALVCEQLPETMFLIVGEAHDPEYLRQLNELAEHLHLQQNVNFLGGRNDVYGLLKACDLFCLPSRSEGMSNALLEAMACRLPCIATDVGGNAEVLCDGLTGSLVPPENPQALAAQIVRLLCDQALMKTMGTAGRRIARERFGVQHMIEQLFRLYLQLLQQRGLSDLMPTAPSPPCEVEHGL